MRQANASADCKQSFALLALAVGLGAIQVFVFQRAGAAESSEDGRISPPQIIAAWRARQERIRSAKVVWVQDRVDKKGSIDVRSSKYIKAPFPAEDTAYSSTETLQLADNKWRLDITGHQWDLTTGRLVKCKKSIVWVDGTSKQFTDSNELWGRIASKENQSPYLGLSDVWPIVWFLRPFGNEQCDLFRCSADDLKVLPTGHANALVVCGTRRPRLEGLRLWLDAARDFLVVRVKLGVNEISIEYRDDAEYGHVPKQWSTVDITANGEEQRVIACRAMHFELDNRIPPSVFDLRFPSGTRVRDESRRQWIANARGELVDDKGELGPRSRIETQDRDGVWRSWLLALNAVVLVCLVAVVVYRYRRKRS